MRTDDKLKAFEKRIYDEMNESEGKLLELIFEITRRVVQTEQNIQLIE